MAALPIAFHRLLRIQSSPLLASASSSLLHQTRRCMGHSIRIVLTEDLPNGKAYKGEVITVKAGFARNHLIPGKMALYATAENFKRLDMDDPDLETEAQKAERLAREALSDEGAEELKAADILKHYLRNKEAKMYRRVDPETQKVFPGMVDALALRKKLSKQLRIDLESHEAIHIRDEIVETEDATEEKLLEMVEAMDVSEPCKVEIRQLGNFVARISLAGGYAVPLKFSVNPS